MIFRRTSIAASALVATLTFASLAAHAADRVTIAVATSPTPNAEYDPRNVLAIWIQDGSGKFVRTLARFGARRVKYLRAWNAIALDRDQIGGDPDVVTGATRSSHTPLSVDWDLTDYQGVEVPDGTYTIRMELADQNSDTPSENNQGTFTFEKNGTPSSATDLSSGGFTSVSIDYTVVDDPMPGPDAGGPGDPVDPPPGGCSAVADCRDNDGCCLPDCVYEVDNDCDPKTARDRGGGCHAGGPAGAPGALVILALWLCLRRRRTPKLWALAVLASGCLGTSPEEQRRDDLGSAADGDEEHRPGQPCLACHTVAYHPGEAVFVLAGTVYRSSADADDQGLAGAQLLFIDHDGREFTADTNRVGNFMVEVDFSLSAPRQLDRGRLQIPFSPEFPISVAVSFQGTDKDMETLIWRDGSCAGCHRTSQAGTDHVEKVWFAEGPS